MSIRPEAVDRFHSCHYHFLECCWTKPSSLSWAWSSLSEEKLSMIAKTTPAPRSCEAVGHRKREEKTRLPPWLATAGSIQAILNPSHESIPSFHKRLLWAVQEHAQWGEGQITHVQQQAIDSGSCSEEFPFGDLWCPMTDELNLREPDTPNAMRPTSECIPSINVCPLIILCECSLRCLLKTCMWNKCLNKWLYWFLP